MLAEVRQNAGLFALLLEPLERPIEALVIMNDDFWHSLTHPSRARKGKCRFRFRNLFRGPVTSKKAALSPWGPAQLPAAQYVQMQMIHALPRISSGIGHDPIAIGIQSLLARDLGRKRQEASEQTFAVRSIEITNRSHMSGGNDQKMHGRLGVDIPERESLLRPLHDLRRNLSSHNPAKQTVSHVVPAIVRWLQLQPRQEPLFRIAEY